MANIRKTFNFRNGVQVDEDNFIVDSLGKVGIGTTVPNQMIDCRGNAKVVGILTSQSLETRNVNVAGVTTFSGTVHVGAAITIYPASGIISATSIRGDGRNLINIPTSQWTDLNSGLGHTSIYNEGFVGVSTNDPRFTFQVGGNNDLTTFASGVGINSTGNIVATGVITATNFKGDLQGNQVIGNLIGNVNATSGVSTVGTVKFDSGHVYNALSVGSTNLNVSGVSTFAGISTFNGEVGYSTHVSFGDNVKTFFGDSRDLVVYHSGIHSWIEDTGTGNLVLKGSRVDIQDTSGNELLSAEGGQYVRLNYGANERLKTSSTGVTVYGIASAGQFTGNVNAGVATITSKLDLGSISSQGINTSTPQSNIHVYQSGISSVHLESGSNESVITLGRGLNKQTTSGGVRYGNTSGAFPYSTVDSLDIINYATGNINFYLEGGANSSTPGNFYWHKRANQTRLMTLTSGGRLGIGITDPINALHVVGTTTCTNDIFAGANVSLKGNADVLGNLTVLGDFNATEINSNFTGNINSTGVSTFININATGDTYTQQLAIGLPNGTALGTKRLQVNTGAEQVWITGTGRVGIRTDAINDGTALDVHTGTALFGAVGVGTTSVKCTADFNAAGYDGGAGTASFMILPRVTNAERGNLTNLMSGAIVYNTQTNKLNFYNGSAWRAVTDAAV